MKKLHYSLLVVFLTILGSGLLAVPTVVRALPGRYASLLPEPLQELRYANQPLTLPTPDESSVELAAALPATATPVPSSTPTATPAPTDTLAPSVTPSPTATETPTPPPTPTPPSQVLLEGLRHERQGWNNCAPTTLAMALSFWGRDDRQMDIAPIVKPDPEDKHVSIEQLRDYAHSVGLEGIIRAGGTLEGLKQFVRAGFPVIVETWDVTDVRNQYGHYRLVIGYDEAAQAFELFDSLYYPASTDVYQGTTMGYQALDEMWRVFNYVYLVIYPAERWNEVAEILGPDIDDETMYQQALERARAELADPLEACDAYINCSDGMIFSWFNVGTNLLALGQPAEAAAAYDQARQLGLQVRVLWYQPSLYEAYYKAGRYDDVIALTNTTLSTAGNLEESLYWQAKARLAQGDEDGARADLRAALKYHEGWEPAATLLAEISQ